MIVNGKMQPITIEQDRMSYESGVQKGRVHKTCSGCKYDSGHLGCDHPKYGTKKFEEMTMNECWIAMPLRNGKPVARSEDITHIRVGK